MLDQYGKTLIFQADDIDDPDWDEVIKILADKGWKTLYADGNYMNFRKYKEDNQ